jgi:Bacteriophage clamp loader A subunit
MTSPWDYIKAINETKEDIIKDEQSEKDYNSFIVNRGLSYFPDTVHYANEMNQHHHVDKAMQFNYLKESIRKRKRFSKWVKPETNDNLGIIIKFYGVSKPKALSILSILTESEIADIKTRMNTGGKV